MEQQEIMNDMLNGGNLARCNPFQSCFHQPEMILKHREFWNILTWWIIYWAAKTTRLLVYIQGQ